MLNLKKKKKLDLGGDIFLNETLFQLNVGIYSVHSDNKEGKLIQGQTSGSLLLSLPSWRDEISQYLMPIHSSGPEYTLMTSVVAMTTGGGRMTTSYCVFWKRGDHSDVQN